MVRPYGLSVRDDLLERGSGQSYAEMGESLLAETVSAELPVDLLVLAFAVSDTLPGTGVWWALADGLPGWTARGRHVLLADYDRLLGALCVSAIDIQPLDPMVSRR
jgi:hypothetical protein